MAPPTITFYTLGAALTTVAHAGSYSPDEDEDECDEEVVVKKADEDCDGPPVLTLYDDLMLTSNNRLDAPTKAKQFAYKAATHGIGSFKTVFISKDWYGRAATAAPPDYAFVGTALLFVAMKVFGGKKKKATKKKGQ